MNQPRNAGILLVILQCLTLAEMTRSLLFPTLIILAASLASRPGLRWRMQSDTHRRVILYLGILFLADGLFRSTPPAGVSGFMMFSLGWSMAQWLLVLQVLHLHGPKGEVRETWPVLAGILVLLAAGNQVMPPTSWKMKYFQGLSLAFTLASLNFLVANPKAPGASRQRFAVLLLAIALALPLSPAVSRSIPWLESWYNRIFNPDMARHAGFSGRLDLSAPDPDGPDAAATALRVESMQIPGYLRGQCFSYFANDEWQGGTRPQSRVPPLAGVIAATSQVSLEITPARDMEGALFTPGGVTDLQLADGVALWNADGIARTLEPGTGSYGITATPGILPPGSTAREELLRIPPDLLPLLIDLQGSIFPPDVPVREKATRLESWFQEHFLYGRPPGGASGTEAIHGFLRQRHPAHCQYFATAGALLLRAAGIPTRVIAGYVAMEQNPLGDYWLARNRDAHAWVEVQDEAGLWFRLDPTPADGRPGHQDGSWAGYLLDAAIHRIQQSVRTLRQQGFRALIPLAGALMVILIAGIILLAGYRLLRRNWRRRPAVAVPGYTEFELRWHSALNRLDRWLEEQGQPVRLPGETLNQLQNRLLHADEEISGAVRVAGALEQAATIRYGKSLRQEENDPAALLEEALAAAMSATGGQPDQSASASSRSNT